MRVIVNGARGQDERLLHLPLAIRGQDREQSGEYARQPGRSPENAIGPGGALLPQPLLGNGAIAEYAELGNFGMRVTMSYQPNTLAQQFTVDVLYGTGVLRNNFAVQVK